MTEADINEMRRLTKRLEELSRIKFVVVQHDRPESHRGEIPCKIMLGDQVVLSGYQNERIATVKAVDLNNLLKSWITQEMKITKERIEAILRPIGE